MPCGVSCPKCNWAQMIYDNIVYDVYDKDCTIKSFKCPNKICGVNYFAYMHSESKRVVTFVDWNWENEGPVL